MSTAEKKAFMLGALAYLSSLTKDQNPYRTPHLISEWFRGYNAAQDLRQ